MPNYKLVYFDARALAEPIRYIFAYSGTNYEDHRVPHDKWPAMKSTTPYHSLPYLEVDGEILGQSNAIARLLAKRLGLAGNGDIQQAKADAIVDYVVDARAPMRTWHSEQDAKRKAELETKMFKEQIPESLKIMENHLKNNNGGKGFFVGDGPTWADFYVACFVDILPGPKDELLKTVPLLKEHNQRVNNLKGIKEWVAKRPETPF